MRTKVSSKGQIVLPAELRDLDRIEAGQQFSVERVAEGEYLLRRVLEPGVGIANWLSSCPARDWFEAIPSESTDQL
ncbi:MAG: AbrB/MazE/SpoVT family DNA-binding domain-containing protein [Vulcanimicrobiota bacterium]